MQGPSPPLPPPPPSSHAYTHANTCTHHSAPRRHTAVYLLRVVIYLVLRDGRERGRGQQGRLKQAFPIIAQQVPPHPAVPQRIQACARRGRGVGVTCHTAARMGRAACHAHVWCASGHTHTPTQVLCFSGADPHAPRSTSKRTPTHPHPRTHPHPHTPRYEAPFSLWPAWSCVSLGPQS